MAPNSLETSIVNVDKEFEPTTKTYPPVIFVTNNFSDVELVEVSTFNLELDDKLNGYSVVVIPVLPASPHHLT